MIARNIRNIRHILPIVPLFAVVLLPVGGCATSEPGTDSCTGQRLIVTTASTSQLSVTALQTLLDRESGKPVVYMRTLFDRHYLFCVGDLSSEQDLAGVMARMTDRPEIQAVEPDRRRSIN